MTLMEIGTEDGEEAATFDSTYVNVSCIVTSDTDGVTATAGECDNPFTAKHVWYSKRKLLCGVMHQARHS